ncbi:MAG: beta-galactosidase [Lachnospiraceae bacterium]|nr:beta-galactosidase [Lachnospiraceae bacterium]
MAKNYQGIHFGTDYYPEHWPRERWETDARLMQEMGIQVVRMAEFSWHKMEPREGQYDFDWLEEAITLLAQYGIKSILGTPSAAPPAWMINKHPDILPIDRQGRRRGFGGRHHDCQSNATYRKYITGMVTAMAKRFADNPNVIGWQTDNELGNSHGDLCMCDSCRRSFQGWLEKKYGTIEALNAAWGTHFWSQEYNSFEEIFAPLITVTGENPSTMLDWKCFCSDLIVDFQQMQIDIIRKYCPNHFITHNCMAFADKVNYFDLNKELDFASHDQYPGGFYAVMPHEYNHDMAANLDITRGFKHQTFWIMEQESGITGWEIMGRATRPGQLAAWAEQSIAHGADAIVFFRWRTCTAGTEQYWHGILPHSGNPGRRYDELKQMIARMQPVMDEIEGSMPRSEVAIVFSYRQEYAIQIQPQHPDLNYLTQVKKYYKELYRRNVPVDFVQDTDDFGKYKLLIAPLQYLMTPELAQRYFDYVKGGGRLVLTMRTGVKDAHNICMSDRELPGTLGELCGIEICDYDCLRDVLVKLDTSNLQVESAQVNVISERETGVESAAGCAGSKWADIITLKGAESLADYASEYYAGSPCITQNHYGDGAAYYVGTEPEEALMEQLMDKLLADAEVKSLGASEPGVELAIREKDGSKWLFAINFNEEAATYEVPADFEIVQGEVKGTLKPYEMHLYKKFS